MKPNLDAIFSSLRDFDLADCIALAPTAAELAELIGWIEYQDANPDWPAHERLRPPGVGR